MKAILLAAGQGTRLKPVTELIPKPLLPIVDRRIIDINLKRLLNAGVSCVGINLFHKHKLIKNHLKTYDRNVHVVVEDVLKGTGGALLNFEDFIDDDFIIQSADVVSDIRYREIVDFHKKHNPMATLVMVRHQGTKFRIGADNKIDRILGYDSTPYTYAGIGVFSKKIFSILPNSSVFTIVDVFRNIFRNKASIAGIPAVIQWYNINSYYDYWKIHSDLLHGRTALDGPKYSSPIYIAPSSNVRSRALHGFVSVAENCDIDDGVHLENSVVLPGTSIASGRYQNCVISNYIRIAVT